MVIFRKYIFPGLYGLLIYFSIRLLHDVDINSRFWQRSWALNTLEMGLSIVVGYLGIALYYKSLVKELLIFVFSNMVLVSAVFIPMAALTDDGLSWADLVDLTFIPAIYTVVYYGIARSNTWLRAYVDNRLQLEKLTNDHLETELKFLKAQYHPHFLFNALNTIYFQMDEDVPSAKKSTELLSALLRYQLYDQQQQVAISQELEYLENYIRFQQIRASDRLRLNVDFDEQLTDQPVYPLLLLPLVENAFKYAGGDFGIDITAKFTDDTFKFVVANDVPAQIAIKENYTGIGLENLRRRLHLLYPDKHQLQVGREGNRFFASIELKF
jgi:two-component system LytT family sensor kinase